MFFDDDLRVEANAFASVWISYSELTSHIDLNLEPGGVSTPPLPMRFW